MSGQHDVAAWDRAFYLHKTLFPSFIIQSVLVSHES